MTGTITGSTWTTTALQLAPHGTRHFGQPNESEGDAGGPGATTSPLTDGGRGFNVTWDHAPG